jgi:long-chain acyl-CoA synthetase
MSTHWSEEACQHAQTWTQSGVFARLWPASIAVYSASSNRTFAALDGNANRLARAMQSRGLKQGDGVTLVCTNRPEFVEVFLACLRIGVRLTPVSTQLTADEVRYIAQDSQSKLMFAEHGLPAAQLSFENAPVVVIGGDSSMPNGFQSCLVVSSPSPLIDPKPGTLMMYTSGTTGRPKGVYRELPEVIEPQLEGTPANYAPGDIALCSGPAYHSAPLLFDIAWPLASGVPIVLMPKWDAVTALDLMAHHKVTHAHLVPTMFARLLAVPKAVRCQYNLASLRFVVHGAAPCPMDVKRAMIEWLGPILTEYYAATEGGSGINVDSATWLSKPGTVGRIDAALGHCILDDHDQPVERGVIGRVFFKAPEKNRFIYFGDPKKTADAYRHDRFTLGDMGYVDDDGFLFLTGRIAECIISGGVNIYPREIDDVLRRHDAVEDVCTVGAPDDEWGERVVSVVVPVPSQTPSPQFADELLAFAGRELASFKRPRQIVFEQALPHTATGKLLRTQVRQRFWAGRARTI